MTDACISIDEGIVYRGPDGRDWVPADVLERVKAERDARFEIASTEGMSVKRDADGHVVAVPARADD